MRASVKVPGSHSRPLPCAARGYAAPPVDLSVATRTLLVTGPQTRVFINSEQDNPSIPKIRGSLKDAREALRVTVLSVTGLRSAEGWRIV